VTKTGATNETTLRLLEEVWERSDRIFGLVDPGALLARPISLRQPFLFYVGHLPAFAWNHLWRGALGRPPFDAELDGLFERGIDPPDDADAPEDEPAAWPPLPKVLAYRDRVRRELPGVLDEPGVQGVLPMVIEHELMHHETLLYMIQQLPEASRAHPGPLPDTAHGPVPERRPVPIPAGPAVLGSPRDGVFRWDNEHPEQTVDVPAFRIDSVPVTNREYLQFIEDGGYEDRRLWTDDSWAWIQKRDHRGPAFWKKTPDSWQVRTLHGDRPFDEAADWPASVMHGEARAFARWEGERLPTEAEFHRAAFYSPDGTDREHPWGDEEPGPAQGNLGFRRWSPTPVGAHPRGASAFGVHELVGNGWEWTSTVFAPFPGFEPLPRYPGYSADFFDGRHFVLLGGSWATDARLVRRSFRNWFQPHYPYVFSKFRCARSD
jgi:ergothioneine biosynthesis protein EgtB